MRSHFDEQLAQLSRELTEMGALCEEVIALSAKALTDGDKALAARVAPLDAEIDQKERDIESLCLKLLLQQQPVARDLRQISAALKMITDMERIGDQAEDIAEIITYMDCECANSTLLREMAKDTIKMVTESVDAYVRRDTELARLVTAEDDIVDDYFAKVKKELIAQIAENPAGGEQTMDFLMIAKYFERIGDHAVNIAEWVIFSVTGIHKSRRFYFYRQKSEGRTVKKFYDLLFQLFDYTRNGIFFAPIFLMLGGYMAEQKPRLTKWWNWAGSASGVVLMFTEGMLLHQYVIPRHDSMCLMLPICMVFLFRGLLRFRGREVRGLRTAARVIYLVHPMVIVTVRAAAKITHLEALLVKSNLVYFVAVCVISFLFGFAVAALWWRFAVKQKHLAEKERAYIELDLASLAYNSAILQAAMPQGSELMAVVKANAYGHGDYEILTHLEKNGVKAFAVATIEEGIRLRRYGIRGMILILGYTDIHRAKELKQYAHLKQLWAAELS